MADPLSLASGLAGLISVADLIATKAYRYLKAVKDCEAEVRQLIAELDYFGGVLRRLEKVVAEEEGSDESDIEAALDHEFVHECLTTLREVRAILTGFEKKAPTGTDPDPPPPPPKKTRKEIKNVFLRISKSDLKWPLSRSKTLDLVQRLERHKTTCQVAISADSMKAMYRILGEQKLTTEKLAEVRTDQKKILEMQLEDRHGQLANKILDWLSPVDPEQYHKRARRLHHIGTGEWFITGSAFTDWLEKPNSALWAYGIPGAGKTILSSLMIENAFSKKHRGVAYYYCTHVDAVTQQPAHILGSLVRQLARQSEEAFEESRACYTSCQSDGRPPTGATTIELIELLGRVSLHFQEVSLLLDGIDECDSVPLPERVQFLQAISQLPKADDSNIKIAITSRREQYIEDQLKEFVCVPIAAIPADLELFVGAEVSRRYENKIRDPNLKADIIETLTNGADGMFQWVKCQLDYLFKLPSDAARRKALGSLPPDLPSTYVRILERLDHEYPSETQTYIRRILLWLAFKGDQHLSMDAIAVAISIEEGNDDSDPTAVPNTSDIIEWCSSLVVFDGLREELRFSHFSVKEFLTSKPDTIQSISAHKYLLKQSEAWEYMANVSLTCLTTQQLPPLVDYSGTGPYSELIEAHPFYQFAAENIVWLLDEANLEGNRLDESIASRKFFSAKPNRFFTLWLQYLDYWHHIKNLTQHLTKPTDALISPLHLALDVGSSDTVLRLLAEGADANAKTHTAVKADLKTHSGAHPLLLACGISLQGWHLRFDPILGVRDTPISVVEALIQHGADVNCTIELDTMDGSAQAVLDPLCLSLIQRNEERVRTLLQHGSKTTENQLRALFKHILKYVSQENYQSTREKLLSILTLIVHSIQTSPEHGSTMMSDFLQEEPTRLVREDSQEVSDTQLRHFLLSIQQGNAALFHDLLRSGIDVDTEFQLLGTPLYAAVYSWRFEFAFALITTGADARKPVIDGICPLLLAYELWPTPMADRLFRKDLNFQLTDAEKHHLFQFACLDGLDELLNYILSDACNSTESVYTPRLCIVQPIQDSPILTILQEHGILNDEELYRTVIHACNGRSDAILRTALSMCSKEVLKEVSNEIREWSYQLDLLDVMVDFGLLSSEQLCLDLILACEKGYDDLVEKYLNAGVHPDVLEMNGGGPIHYAVTTTKILRMLVEKGADINLQDVKGRTSICVAAELGLLRSVAYLLSQGADAHRAANNELSPLHIAAARGHADVCKVLVDSGVNIESRLPKSGRTALMLAVERGRLNVVKTLIDLGAQVNTQTTTDWTALHFAAARKDLYEERSWKSSIEITNLLLSAGADIEGAKTSCIGPLALAAQFGDLEYVRMMLEKHDYLDMATILEAAVKSWESLCHRPRRKDLVDALTATQKSERESTFKLLCHRLSNEKNSINSSSESRNTESETIAGQTFAQGFEMLRRGSHDGLVKSFHTARTLLERESGSKHPAISLSLQWEGLALADQHHYVEAERALQLLLCRQNMIPGTFPATKLENRASHAYCLARQERYVEAKELYEQILTDESFKNGTWLEGQMMEGESESVYLYALDCPISQRSVQDDYHQVLEEMRRRQRRRKSL